ncbi:2-C-methyl-D-erythritol 2,4-cyclodiphosphate synthase [Tepidanaerobacter sp. EBM-38]|jgi:2-C-methyl-D-erythritol 2,4-cyclodiphosphate synthase|uniref:2-C-methyl-D-erythritol 2,4-cyclodiphosphate synthase n=1 Tax=Tepidanaerobacter sp. EBM-38 TaxID=1918496 RepID=UPI000ADF3FD3|nr:2-C-methyl-D-erythritol 2,4-cyclodiphosphate synthase [Tepidanaerobacter sp. EBM-38]
MRIGLGFDVHKLVVGRKLVLGGVIIPFEKGLLGHSDADVLVHAINDALLGAAALGDIGKHFPDNDPIYKDISSLMLLKKVKELLSDAGYQVVNIDSVICAQKPKLSPYIGNMCKNIADTLDVDIDRISIKATTTEELGFEGRGEGISAQAICMIEKKYKF